jgi:hypothetical protein
LEIECTDNGKVVRCPLDPELHVPLNATAQNENPWDCITCQPTGCGTKEKPFESLKGSKCLVEKGHRVGVDVQQWPGTHKTKQRKVDSVRQKLLDVVDDECLVSQIVSYHAPKPYPSPKPTTRKDLQDSTRIHGRRFEICQLLLSVEQCSCCDFTKPVYDPPAKKVEEYTQRLARTIAAI